MTLDFGLGMVPTKGLLYVHRDMGGIWEGYGMDRSLWLVLGKISHLLLPRCLRSPASTLLRHLFLFLDASSHLYRRVCPSVGRSVGP